MSKGADTRTTILDEAMRQASLVGLEGLSIGTLASALHLSKSGLFAHFGSKERLQVAILEAAAQEFIDGVVAPALREPRGEPRVRALLQRWLRWVADSALPGGCLFVTTAVELDDRPGPAREVLVAAQRDWLDTLTHATRLAVQEGHFRADLDIDQFAYEMYAMMIGGHNHLRLLRDPRFLERATLAIEHLLATAH